MKSALSIISILKRYQVTKQAVTFLLIGSLSTLISYSTFLISLRFLKLHYLLANIVGFCCSIGVNYQCNKRWTFRAEGNHFKRYFSLYLLSLLLSSLLLRVFVEFFGIIPEIANILTIILITAFNFIGAKFVVFKK